MLEEEEGVGVEEVGAGAGMGNCAQNLRPNHCTEQVRNNFTTHEASDADNDWLLVN